jgi:phage gpG-like protein
MMNFKTDSPLKLTQWIKNTQTQLEAIENKNNLLYPTIQKILDQSTIKNFESAGRPKWKDRKNTYRWPPLRKTQLMMRRALSFIRGKWKRQGGGFVLEVWTVFYGEYQQHGTRNKDGSERLPPRPYLKLLLQEKTEIVQAISLIFGKFKKIW